MKFICRHLPTLLVFSFVFALAACSKDGAQGPAGPAGAQGPAGSAGAAGPKGDPGTANVIYSTWQNVLFDSTFIKNGKDSVWSGEYEGYISAPKLTADILTSGSVHVYMNFGTASNPVIAPLPYVADSVYIGNIAAKGVIGIFANVDASSYYVGNNQTDIYFQYRYVIVPGGVAARSAINWKDYNEVKKALNLKD
ncbi:hypothetical protein DVR12_21580 [Chitinophaga silvatica]|uniref:Collagen-like protein n=1 Tax=Chitinophaga silvatica TaxID=2282649 RepID=A0A3E1Y4S2_9BACT|nr:hypothetical protein [Chitinophaga silvatica]RFS19698.1 hypothetical protein DVR12_21580 [Chitinophaga silvatica]